MTTTTSLGKLFWDCLRKNLNAHAPKPATGNTTRDLITGVSAKGVFVTMSADDFFAHATETLVTSGRVYRWEDSICIEVKEPGSEQLLIVATRDRAEPGAAAHLSHLFTLGMTGEKSMTESLPPAKLAGAVLADPNLWRQLPRIKYYSRRPIFDENYCLRGPGWHTESGILVHGPTIEPILPTINAEPATAVLDRLPPLLRRLFREFCWQSEADMINALSMLLTGLLANHFIDNPHPGFLVDGNQPGLGKTLLIQAFGRILDGFEPPRIRLVGDEELEKKLCAQLRDGRSSIFFFDNQRERIESAILEANMLSPLLCFRILGRSATISRPNNYLWVVTANLTVGTSDFLRRCVPVRLHHEGDPKKRDFDGKPLEFVTQHRREILGELAGLVIAWRQAGMPLGKQKHRCSFWAQRIGGIHDVAGVGNHFLANLDEAETAMDEGLQTLVTLAEFVVTKDRRDFFGMAGTDISALGQPAKKWTDVVVAADVCREKLAERSAKGRDTVVGQFLAGNVDRTVEITVPGGNGTATLRSRLVRANQKVYWFEIAGGGNLDGSAFGGLGGPPATPWMPSSGFVDGTSQISSALVGQNEHTPPSATATTSPAATELPSVGDSTPPPTPAANLLPAPSSNVGEASSDPLPFTVDASSGNDLQW